MCKNEGWDRISNRKDNAEGKMRMNLFLTSNSGQINPQRGDSHSCCKSSLLQKKKLALELGLQKNDFGGKGFGWGVQMQIYLQEERRHLKPRVSNAWLIRGTGSCSAWLEHHFHKDGRNHWKGRLGPRSIHGTARY